MPASLAPRYEGDEDLVVVAVRVFALTTIVAEVVAGGEPGFYGTSNMTLLFPSMAADMDLMGLAASGFSLLRLYRFEAGWIQIGGSGC